MDNNRPVTISITIGTAVKAVLVLLAVWFLFQLKDLVLVLLTAIVIATALEPGVNALHRRKIPRILAIILIYLGFIGSFIAIFYFFIPPFFEDIAGLIISLPVYLESINHLGAFQEYAQVFGNQNAVIIPTDTLMQSVRNLFGAAGMFGNAFNAITSIFGGVFSFILILVFSFYFTVIRTGVDDFLELVSPPKYREYVLDLWERSRRKIGLWMQGQLLLAVIVGILVFLGLTLFGVKHALLLAIVAAIFEMIPVFGPILAAVPAVGIAFADGGLTLGLITIAIYAIIQQFENHLIYPLVVTRVVGVPPLLVIIALIIGAQLAGFLGILLSIPAAAIIQELAKDIKGRRFLAMSEE